MLTMGTSERNEAAEKLLAKEGCGACSFATHEALKARAVADLAGERAWTKILDTILALQKAKRHPH